MAIHLRDFGYSVKKDAASRREVCLTQAIKSAGVQDVINRFESLIPVVNQDIRNIMQADLDWIKGHVQQSSQNIDDMIDMVRMLETLSINMSHACQSIVTKLQAMKI
jgi:hypothetical protein